MILMMTAQVFGAKGSYSGVTLLSAAASRGMSCKGRFQTFCPVSCGLCASIVCSF